ncbi:MAG: hypothetical protein KBS70_04035 [Bacteroidales bacterium]|nr:hypothetical protein [Candidatus Colicola equi]
MAFGTRPLAESNGTRGYKAANVFAVHDASRLRYLCALRGAVLAPGVGVHLSVRVHG